MHLSGAVALTWIVAAVDRGVSVSSGSDRRASSVNACSIASMTARVDAEFVVAAAEVLHERVTADDHAGGAVAFEAAHRSEPGFEPAVVALDPVVRVLLSVVKRGRHESSIAARNAGARSVTTSTGSPCARSARGEEPARRAEDRVGRRRTHR